MAKRDHRKVIAIDGPAAAGKSTVAQELANSLGIMLFDTGALYRAVTLKALQTSADLDSEKAIAKIARKAKIKLKKPSIDDGRQTDVLLDGEDVTWSIRQPDVDSNVSKVAAYPAVRDALLDVQRDIADGNAIVMVGRDIGTVVTPKAGTKIYFDASVEERARRRYQDMRRQGEEMEYAAVLEELRQRDYKDASRVTAPLRVADDAVRIVTDGLDIDEVVGQIQRIVQERWSAHK